MLINLLKAIKQNDPTDKVTAHVQATGRHKQPTRKGKRGSLPRRGEAADCLLGPVAGGVWVSREAPCAP